MSGYFRSATIWGLGDVLSTIANVPGYTLQQANPFQPPERTHMIITPSGDQIHLVKNPADHEHARTSNVINQDARNEFVPFQNDELVRFANAAHSLNVTPDEPIIRVTVHASEHDLQTL
ncbi:hypothetical protein WLF14_14190 [Pseudomonas fluorescens]|uniref:Uncharacterized protein n=1 Tax=Pseudomonas fluorescens TaxID=294 RepID=A0A7M2JEF5_PSEFL|nr:hypothetical protein [Pseudomonas fluorescens]QOU08035.1 hypothetical protein IM720_15340 [Pseudomonas fluorescens]